MKYLTRQRSFCAKSVIVAIQPDIKFAGIEEKPFEKDVSKHILSDWQVN